MSFLHAARTASMDGGVHCLSTGGSSGQAIGGLLFDHSGVSKPGETITLNPPDATLSGSPSGHFFPERTVNDGTVVNMMLDTNFLEAAVGGRKDAWNVPRSLTAPGAWARP